MSRSAERIANVRPVNNDGISRSATLGSVANAARVLKAFTPNEREWGVTDLARRMGIAKSTAHRLLATLTDENLLEQDTNTGRYRLGLAIFDMAAAAQSVDLHEAVMAPMTDLRNRTGETVQVAVLDGRDVVYVERLDSPNTLRLFLEVGRRNSAHSTGCGKALLPHCHPTNSERTLRNWKLQPKTEHTIIDTAVLRKDLQQARRRGYAVNRRESEAGVVSVRGANP
jgi:IclR family acetate operon transcriptional repressor